MRSISRRPALSFAIAASLVLGACSAVLRSHAFAQNPDVAAWGITFDLTITIPLLYWFFVVRGGHARPLTLVPIFLLGMLLATRLVPANQQQFAHQLGRFVVPLAELLAIGAVVRGVRSGDGLLANVLASELTMFRYALLGWRMKPEPRERAVTFHERSGWGVILIGIFVLIAAEGIAMHLLLAQWKVTAAWAWTALDLWAVVWLLGDYHALRVRRTWLDDDTLHVQLGTRWSVDVARANIESIEAVRDEKEWKRKDVLRLAILDEPRWLITLREPVVAHGLVGLKKTIRAIAVLPDQDDWITHLR